MRNRKAVAAVDASVEGNSIAASWIITTLDNTIQVEGDITSEK